jgi:hypothetical protein
LPKVEDTIIVDTYQVPRQNHEYLTPATISFLKEIKFIAIKVKQVVDSILNPSWFIDYR